MHRGATESFEALLIRINHEIESISRTQHQLARHKALLQEQATRLRLGASPLSVSVALREAVGLDLGPDGDDPWTPSGALSDAAPAAFPVLR